MSPASYQLLYSAIKILMVDPVGLEPTTDRLWAGSSNQLSYGSKMVAVVRLELTTSRVWTVRSSQLSYTATRTNIMQKWWILTGSNRWPPACKTGALPAELRTHTIYYGNLVPKAGIEPARYCYHGILSPTRLPIPPLRRQMVSPRRFERPTHWLKVSCSADWATKT